MTKAENLSYLLSAKINEIKSNCSPTEAPYISAPGLPGGSMMFYSVQPLTDSSVIVLGIDISKKPAYFVSPADQFTASIFIGDLIDMFDAKPPLGFRLPDDLP